MIIGFRALRRAMVKRFVTLALLMLLAASSTTVATAQTAEDLLRQGQERFSSRLAPVSDLLSGAMALVVDGEDFRLNAGPRGTLEEVGGERSPVLQAAAAALVPFRSPTAKFSRNVLLTRDMGQLPFQTEPHIAVNPEDPEHLLVGVIDYNAPNVDTYVSLDGGATWEGPYQPRYLDYDLGAGGDPSVAFDRQGSAYLSSISVGFEQFAIRGFVFVDFVSSIAITTSNDGGFTWERPVSSSRSRIEVRVDPTVQEGIIGFVSLGFLDKPWMTVGPSQAGDRDVVYVTYTKFTVQYSVGLTLEGALLYFVNPVVESVIELVRSEDGGQTWSAPIAVSPVARRIFTSEAGGGVISPGRVVQGSQPLAAPEGTVYVAWLDSTEDGAFRNLAEIWTARSDDGGRTFERPVLVSAFLEPDFSSRNAFFRSWGAAFPQVSAGRDGSVSLVYTGRPSDKPTDDGDVFYVRSGDRGTTWSRPVRVNDDQTDRFQFFPTVAVAPNGSINVMWGDFRDDRTEFTYHIYYSKSDDQGRTFVENARVTDFPSNPNRAFPRGVFIGDYFGITATEADVYMVWADGRLGEFGAANQKIGFARLRPMPAPSIFVSPPRGPAGKDVIIQGFNFQPDQEIFIEVSGAIVTGARTNEEGRFTISAFLPISSEGAHSMRVIDATGNVAGASFFTEFGFDSLQEEVAAIATDVRNLNGTNSGTDGTSPPSPASDTLTARIDALRADVGALSGILWMTAGLAIVAIVLAGVAVALLMRRRSPASSAVRGT